MATSEWIESAAREPKAPGGDGFVDRKARHILAGAGQAARHDPREEAAAARLLTREAPDVAEAVGITLPEGGPDPASTLVGLAARGRLSYVRGWIGDRDRAEISAIRTALAARRRDR